MTRITYEAVGPQKITKPNTRHITAQDHGFVRNTFLNSRTNTGSSLISLLRRLPAHCTATLAQNAKEQECLPGHMSWVHWGDTQLPPFPCSSRSGDLRTIRSCGHMSRWYGGLVPKIVPRHVTPLCHRPGLPALRAPCGFRLNGLSAARESAGHVATNNPLT